MNTNNGTLTIQQVAAATGLSVYTLRYYERVGLIHPIGRLDNTHRRYTEWDVGWLDFLTKLRKTGMSIQQMQRYAQLQRLGDHTLPERLEMLRAHYVHVEAHIDELEENLKVLRYKIDMYGQACDCIAAETTTQDESDTEKEKA